MGCLGCVWALFRCVQAVFRLCHYVDSQQNMNTKNGVNDRIIPIFKGFSQLIIDENLYLIYSHPLHPGSFGGFGTSFAIFKNQAMLRRDT